MSFSHREGYGEDEKSITVILLFFAVEMSNVFGNKNKVTLSLSQNVVFGIWFRHLGHVDEWHTVVP